MQRVSEPNMQSNMSDSSNTGSKLPWVVLAVIVLILIIVAVLFRDKLLPNNDTGKTTQTEEKLSGYQAVFLTNGQVYFGKFSDTAAHYSTLKDIYYLQVTQPALQGSQENAQAANQQPQLSLVKLGSELHGPVDEMKLNRDQILFFENIKEDGKVMQAIREYQKNPPVEDAGGAVPAPGTNAPQQPAGQTQTQQQAPATSR